jgi:hypothetical protein
VKETEKERDRDRETETDLTTHSACRQTGNPTECLGWSVLLFARLILLVWLE